MIAYEDAIRQIWPLEGYLLAQRMFEKPSVTLTVPSVLEEAHKQLIREIEQAQAPWNVSADDKGRLIAKTKPAKKRGRPRKVDAPWGLKKDGTPKKRPGRQPS